MFKDFYLFDRKIQPIVLHETGLEDILRLETASNTEDNLF